MAFARILHPPKELGMPATLTVATVQVGFHHMISSLAHPRTSHVVSEAVMAQCMN